MKNLILIILFFCLIVSCKKDFLDQPPEDQLTSEIFYKNVAQINMGIIGCYTPLQGIYNGGNLAWTLGLVSDEISAWNYVVEPVDLFNKDFNNSISWLWSTGYNNIQRCNRMIKVIKDGGYEVKPNETALLNSYLAEAEFIRALNYFNMVRLYGAVPLVTEPFTDPDAAIGIGRAPVSEIFDKVIIPGFKYAAENALVRSKLGNQIGRVTSGAGYTLLAEAYMTLKKYPEAEAALKKVIDSKEYDLMPTLSQVFSTTTENNRESIFEIQYDQNLGNGSLYNRWIGWNIAPFVGATASNQSINVSKALVALYKADNDMQRFNTWITESIVNPSGLLITDPFPKKYVTTGLGVVAQNNNFIVTRYADVILMYAEALAMQNPGRVNEILADVNRIRTRAGMPVFANSEALTLDAIYKERQLELAFEGHRWFDLLRTGRAQNVMSSTLGITVQSFQLLFPIPISEIQKDPTLPQTPGY